MGTNGVSVVETTLSSCWSAHNLGSDVEQVGLLIVLEQVIVEVGFGPFGVFLGDGPVVHRAIVIRQTPGTSNRADGNVWGDVVDLGSRASTLSPIGEEHDKVKSVGMGCLIKGWGVFEANMTARTYHQQYGSLAGYLAAYAAEVTGALGTLSQLMLFIMGIILGSLAAFATISFMAG